LNVSHPVIPASKAASSVLDAGLELISLGINIMGYFDVVVGVASRKWGNLSLPA